MWVILKLQVLLRGKEFILETDHRNLIWMEKSLDPKIVRMVEAIRTFIFVVRHIGGRINLIADVISRMFPKANPTDIDACCVAMVDDCDDFFGGDSETWFEDVDVYSVEEATVESVLDEVHGKSVEPGEGIEPSTLTFWVTKSKMYLSPAYA